MANENQLIELEQLVQAQVVKALESKKSLDNIPKVYTEDDLNDLEQRNLLFSKTHVFAKNQLVKWKKGLKNRKLPKENQPAVVIDVLSPPLISEAESGTPYFREPLDILLGFIDERDGDFLVFHYDSRRFEPYTIE